MSVTLRRKKHKDIRGRKGPRKNKVEVIVSEKYSAKKYYIYKNCAALSLDKKTLYRLDTNYEGDFVVPNGVEFIDPSAFKDCDKLSGVFLPPTLKQIYPSSFEYCAPKFVYYSCLPETVYDLTSCCKIKAIYVPNESIDYYAQFLTHYIYCGFLLCSNSTKLLYHHANLSQIGDNETKVDSYGVTYTLDGETLVKASKSIENYTIPEGVKMIADNAFEKTKLKSVVFPKSLRLIGANAFGNCSKLSKVQLNSGIKRIGSSAFQNCKSLSSFKMPNSVEDIGFGVFEGCSSLSEIKLSDNLQLIPRSSFSHTQIKTISIPEKTVYIGEEAFACCQSLESIVIPDKVKCLWDGCFSLCTNLKDIVLPNHIIKFGEGVFEGCSSLQTVPDLVGLKDIPEYFFSGCSSLEKFTLPDTVERIGEYAFADCIALKEVVFPTNLRVIASDAFSGCKSLQKINLPANVRSILNSAFYKCCSLESIELPESVEYLEACAFQCCTNLRNVVIKGKVQSIYTSVFYSCSSIESILLPYSVDYISDYAFDKCVSLKTISISNPACRIDGDLAFRCCNSLKSIFVPRDSVERFKEMLPEHKDIIKPKHFAASKKTSIKKNAKNKHIRKLIDSNELCDYAEYLNYCYDTEITESDELSAEYRNWHYESIKPKYKTFFEDLKNCKAYNELYVITYRDRWHGCVTGYVHKVFNNLVDAVKEALEPTTDFRDNSIYFEYGKIVVTGYSGKRIKTVVINQLSKNGVRWLTGEDPNPNWDEYIKRKTVFKNIKLGDLSC